MDFPTAPPTQKGMIGFELKSAWTMAVFDAACATLLAARLSISNPANYTDHSMDGVLNVMQLVLASRAAKVVWLPADVGGPAVSPPALLSNLHHQNAVHMVGVRLP